MKKSTKFCLYTYFKLSEYVKSLNIPVICFPRGIKNYKEYCSIVKPNAVCIDYEDPQNKNEIQIPIQGGLDPKICWGIKTILKKKLKNI